MHTPIHRKKKSKFTHQKKVYKTTSRQVKNMVIFEKFLQGFAAYIKIIEACLDTTL